MTTLHKNRPGSQLPNSQHLVSSRYSRYAVPLAIGLWILVTGTQSMAATKIYKTIDVDGNVVYTDVAPTRREAESELKVEELNTFSTPDPGPAELPVVVLKNEDATEETDIVASYTAIAIASPGNDAPVRANNGNISLQASIQPALQATHQLRFYLDGNPVGTVADTQLALNNVDRGTHQAKVAVLDGSGSVLMESEVSTFHLLRVSIQQGGKR